MKYEAQHFPLLKGFTNFTGPYSGVPTPDIDEKWEALMKSKSRDSSSSNLHPLIVRLDLVFRITEEEMKVRRFCTGCRGYNPKTLAVHQQYQLTHRRI